MVAMDLHAFAAREQEVLRERLRRVLPGAPGEVGSVLDLPVLKRWIPQLEQSAGTSRESEVIAGVGTAIMRGFCRRYASAAVARFARPGGGVLERGVYTWMRETGLPSLRASTVRIRVSSLADLARLARLLAYHENWLCDTDGDSEVLSWVYNTPAALISRLEASGLLAARPNARAE